jgi:hypothetical protein
MTGDGSQLSSSKADCFGTQKPVLSVRYRLLRSAIARTFGVAVERGLVGERTSQHGLVAVRAGLQDRERGAYRLAQAAHGH